VITTLSISGMSCNHCVQHVSNALRAVGGVARVDVDLDAGKATIDHGEVTTTAELIGAVESAGYAANANATSAEACSSTTSRL
jgi:copper chaperone CopZ